MNRKIGHTHTTVKTGFRFCAPEWLIPNQEALKARMKNSYQSLIAFDYEIGTILNLGYLSLTLGGLQNGRFQSFFQLGLQKLQ